MSNQEAEFYSRKLFEAELEIKKLKNDLNETEKCLQDSRRLAYLIEHGLVVTPGISSYWVSEPSGVSRVGPKCTTPRDAIDEYIKIHTTPEF